MSLTPRHQSGSPVPSRKQTLADSYSLHNPFSILVRQLFPSASRNTGEGIYYNIHEARPDNDLDDDRNLYRNTTITYRNVINFDDYRTRTSSQRMSARDSGSHPSALRSSGSRRLGRPDRMAREQLSARRRLARILFWNLPVGASLTLGPLLSDRLRPDTMGRSISEHQSRSESLRRIRQEALDSLNAQPAPSIDVRGTTNGEPA